MKIFRLLILISLITSLALSVEVKKDKSLVSRLYSKKKLNPFLLPYIMWMPYRNDRKKHQKTEPKKTDEIENIGKRQEVNMDDFDESSWIYEKQKL